MKYVLRTEYDCIVKSLSKEEFLDKNSQVIFDEPCSILVYPLQNNDQSIFPFGLDLHNPESSFCKILNQEDFCYVFLTNPPQIETSAIETFDFNGRPFKIFIAEKHLRFQSEKTEKKVLLNTSFKTYSCQKQDPFLLVHLSGKNECLFCLNTKTDSLTKLWGDKIEVLDKQIIVTKTANSNFSQKTLETYSLFNGELQKISSSTKNESFEHIETNLIPYIFLNSIKNGNFEMAKELLDENLKNQINDISLKNYFGEILSFFNLKDHEYCVFSKNKESIYTFKLNQNRICEIIKS